MNLNNDICKVADELEQIKKLLFDQEMIDKDDSQLNIVKNNDNSLYEDTSFDQENNYERGKYNQF